MQLGYDRELEYPYLSKKIGVAGGHPGGPAILVQG
jgi:hypothetical protein